MRYFILCAALALFGTRSVAAENVVYAWVDDAGTVHFTDDLAQVPEPYLSMYAAEIRAAEERRAEERSKAGTKRKPQEPEAAPSRPERPKPSIADSEEQKRLSWQKKVADARKELSAATDALQAAQQRRNQIAINPIMAVTPHVKARLEKAEADLAAAEQRVQRAKAYLLEDLPAKAKKAGVPYKWLL